VRALTDKPILPYNELNDVMSNESVQAISVREIGDLSILILSIVTTQTKYWTNYRKK